ncbi:MAG TPA: alpha-glucan family phosphorylase [Gemmataceae bacterium]|jgi:starch phosphorylase|nr:alpha-glucan family phosphorylase [Gemmataceae bacterium]
MVKGTIRPFTVLPKLPPELQSLQTIAYNMWWCWHPDAVALFRRIEPDLYELTDNSPVKLLGATPQSRFEQLSKDDGFLAHLERVRQKLNDYLEAPTWFQEQYPPSVEGQKEPFRIGYFSMEFGIHESIPEYSGGLGVLAGDHLKSASDLGIPLIGVTLMFRQGYFRQYLNVDGWQQERYPENDFFNLPLVAVTEPDGSPLLVRIPFPNREVVVRVWRIQVGRVPLYLLDANIPQNTPDDRNITAQLYGGDQDMRIRQEMVLGIGGILALRALGLEPTVCHMNEGHSAFCGLERIRLLMAEKSVPFPTALEVVKAGTCFTTHTPVPAGNDTFPPATVEYYLGHYMHTFRIDRHEFLGLGRQNPRDEGEPFGMTVLAIKLANVSNGVSQLHGRVSRRMWQKIWPGLPESEIPIISITNGVHTQSWLAPEMTQLYDRYLGIQWEEQPANHDVWKRVDRIPDEELWRTHERRRERLVAFARKRLKDQMKQRGVTHAELASADEVLDPEALTIGFARRFATYKRGTLIFRNLERLAALLNHKDQPVQFIFAGKAHPKDTGGKELIAQIQRFARQPEFRRRIVFIEDYDMNIARTLVQGVDVWLNNPRRPFEASGTSGMKICGNGGLNLSVLDGWWVEGYQGDNGFAIGAGEEYSESAVSYQDDVESRALYDLLEKELVPLYYARGTDGLPRGWLKMMKRSISTLTPVFNTNRMLEQYMRKAYWPSKERYAELSANDLKLASDLAQWRRRLFQNWGQVRVEGVDKQGVDTMKVGDDVVVSARIHLGPLTPNDVEVQLFHGQLDSLGEISEPQTVSMGIAPGPEPSANGEAMHVFRGRIPCRSSGQFGFCVRVLPKHHNLPHSFEPGLVTWG